MSIATFLRRAKKSRFLIFGLIGLIILLLMVLVFPHFLIYEYDVPDLRSKNLAPQWFSQGLSGHVLGCDPLGRDIVSRTLYGGRVSLFISVVVVSVSLVIGTLLGLISGMFGGWVDVIIMRITEIFMAVPALMLALCVVAVLGVNFSNLIVVMLLTSWCGYTRLVRGSVMAIRNSEYVRASQVMGAGKFRIMLTQILPNVVTPIIIQGSQHMGTVILAESGLSFLGCGVPVPTPAWGSMIADGRQYLGTAPWIVIVPGIALMFTVLTFNFLGDGLRDCLDPRNKD